jgi:hypothetical protein
MSQDLSDVNRSVAIVDLPDQPITITMDIENRALSYEIGVWIDSLHINQIPPDRRLRGPVPCVQRVLGQRVSSNELPKWPAG